MVFDNFADLLKLVHILEDINISIHIIDSCSNSTVYESTQKDRKNTGQTNEKDIASKLYTIYSATAEIDIIAEKNIVDTVITIPIVIHDKKYILMFKQSFQRNAQGKQKTHKEKEFSLHEIKEIAVTDCLTKLYNRRYIDERLPIDMQSSFELDEPVSILFIDIDNFKYINDENGHAAGDQVLREIASILQKQMHRRNGWIARYGGDEILICLPGSIEKTAKNIAHRIRKSIVNNSFYIGEKEVTITCSIGVQTVFKDSGIADASELMALADKKLYKAKESGRNKVI